MAFCGKCGSSVGDGMAFCGSCGASIGPGSTPVAAQPASGLGNNLAAALTYLLGFITGILFLVLEPYRNDGYVRFHAFQSIIFSVAITVFWIVWSNLFWMLFSGFGLGLVALLGAMSTLLSLALLVYWLFLMYKAYNNHRYMIPVIGQFAARHSG